MALWSGMPPSAVEGDGEFEWPSTIGPSKEPLRVASWFRVASACSAEEGSVTRCLRKPSIGPRAAIAASTSGSAPGW